MTPPGLPPDSTSDDRLARVTVGDRIPHDDVIHLTPYDAAWPAAFDELAGVIRGALSGRVVRLEHVGSTSVPGLSAKPIIDMVLEVEDSTREEAYVPVLEARGFVLRIREPDWFEHRLLKAPEIAGNLHVFTRGCEEVERMVAFRDRLRAHEPDRRLYQETKVRLAARRWRHVQDYADAKSEVVRSILTRVDEG